ncbi:dolichyl-phosphate-mannose--protein O- mannosyl transferase [Corynebacterium renale]|uniref:Polyprenol-phosphate-mannose--protein mannosyltransferase n=1 Tax=Corynebacterium renale TaxID=1724 RepID=A0A2A9DLX8_9CORY|nr:dolichyl-phosphate-mannose-protein mannosyltransferase [Corynebacterium renale]SQI25216.1 dolichyl-phosphate-mannose--protein O- mannosyl transferase [Corynebacterium renale]
MSHQTLIDASGTTPQFTAPAYISRKPLRTPWKRPDTLTFVILGLVAALSRYIGLGSAVASGTPVFDEKHYVPQGYDMVRSWINPLLGGIESNPGYGLVVHPPLGKRLLALGEFVFGYSPWGWRVMTALCGTLTILAIMALARELSQSWEIAAFAGIIAICDGVLLVSARFGMLDIFQVTFIVAAAWMLACDRNQVIDRFHDHVPGLPAGGWATYGGPRIGFRWWRFGAGIMLGAAMSVKWSGLYYIIFFLIASLVGDVLIRRRYGAPRPWSGMFARDCIPATASLAVLPGALYLWSWRSWFASETAVYRHATETGQVSADSWLRSLPLPDSLINWLYYHFSVLEFHSSLTTSGGHSHPWDSKPWSWLVAGRPVLYLSSTDVDCAVGTCRRMIYLFGTPIIWWLTIPILLWGLWRLIGRRDGRFAVPVVAFAAGFIPWLIGYDRQMYFFYATALVPFTIVLLALALGFVQGRGSVIPWRWLQRLAGGPMRWGTFAVIVYLGAVVAMFAAFSPILYGYLIPEAYYNQLMWLPSWR